MIFQTRSSRGLTLFGKITRAVRNMNVEFAFVEDGPFFFAYYESPGLQLWERHRRGTVDFHMKIALF